MAKPIEIEVDGVIYPSQSAFCNAFDIDYTLYRSRKRRNWTLKEQIQGYRDTKPEFEITDEQQLVKTMYNRLISNRIINNINELIEAINSFPEIKRINLIDYENISDNKLLMHNHINDPNIINIFFYNACIYSNNYYHLNKDSKSINFQILSTESADQLVDHMLIFYLSIISYKFPDKQIKIYSNDNGYYPFINTLNNENITIAELNKSLNRGFKYKLAKYILNHGDITESKYFYKNDFKRLFIDFYNDQHKKINRHSINNLIGELTRFGFIDSIELSDTKQYRFCIKEISEYKKNVDK